MLPEDDPNFRRLKELHTISMQTRMARAEATVRTAQAQAEADVVAARRAVELEKQTTQTEVVRREAEHKIIEAQAEAEVTRQAGLAEAQVMAAKGYTEKDVIQADVQKAYAAGIGNMGPVVSGGSGSGIVGDLMGLSVGMAAASAITPQIGNMMQSIGIGAQTQSPQPADSMTAFKAKVEKLTMMKDSGLLTEEEFNSMKAQLLSSIM